MLSPVSARSWATAETLSPRFVLGPGVGQEAVRRLSLPSIREIWEAATGEYFPDSDRNRKKPKLDLATNRHYMERFVAPAARMLNLNSSNSSESFFMKVMKEYRNSQGDIQIPPPEEEEAEISEVKT